MLQYSTRAAAKKLGISFMSLMRYIKANKIPAPESVQVGGSRVRAWTEEQVELVRKILPTIANGRKTRYKKKQSAVGTQQSAKSKKKKQSKPRKK